MMIAVFCLSERFFFFKKKKKMNSSAKALPNLSKYHILSLYRHLLKGSNRFSDYNFREYALRIVKEDFKKYKTLSDSKQIFNMYQRGFYFFFFCTVDVYCFFKKE